MGNVPSCVKQALDWHMLCQTSFGFWHAKQGTISRRFGFRCFRSLALLGAEEEGAGEEEPLLVGFDDGELEDIME
eukprot:3462191-Prymnesium_polylepis.1